MTDVRATRAKPTLWLRVREGGGRGDRSALGLWVWDIDRVLLLLALLAMAVGLLAVAAASPASAVRYSGEHHKIAPLYYFWWQVAWVGVSLPVMIAVSMMPVSLARRMALIGTAFFVVMLIMVPIVGVEKNGARRWLDLGVSLFQPSEFLKPCFVVTTAWLLSLRGQDKSLPMQWITAALTALIGFLLMLQPDFGQTMIFGVIWLAMMTIAGTSPRVLALLAACVPVGLGLAYAFYATARKRIDGFLFPDAESSGNAVIDHYQTDMAHATLTAGGVTGTGPGGGTVKFKLPEAHTDYIYSVIGEEFGLFVCALIAILFLAIVIRVFIKLLDEENEFRLLASAGLATQFGAQALVSMAVNTGLVPSKGMTLPFISYGGSSMIALSLGMGLLLAFTRRNPFLTRSPYVRTRET
ncbi:MAG TPA: putative peptidoglycan glycosyltransferase FtsW [Sphingomicrobium sp.]